MHKKLFIVIATFFIFQNAFTQIQAVTNTGEEVLLFENGTWKYKNDSSAKSWKTILDTFTFNKSVKSNFLLKSEKNSYGIWVDPKKWSFKKNSKSEVNPSEFNFSLINEDAYAMIISEKIEIPIENLKDIALKNAMEAAPDSKLVYEDVRKINGILMHTLELEGTLQGINFTYMGYYYSGEKGSIQFICYTAKNLFKKYKSEIENLLNGFVIL